MARGMLVLRDRISVVLNLRACVDSESLLEGDFLVQKSMWCSNLGICLSVGN